MVCCRFMFGWTRSWSQFLVQYIFAYDGVYMDVKGDVWRVPDADSPPLASEIPDGIVYNR